MMYRRAKRNVHADKCTCNIPYFLVIRRVSWNVLVISIVRQTIDFEYQLEKYFKTLLQNKILWPVSVVILAKMISSCCSSASDSGLNSLTALKEAVLIAITTRPPPRSDRSLLNIVNPECNIPELQWYFGSTMFHWHI